MLHPSPIEYAKCGQAYVAYRTCGDGPIGLVLISDWFGHVDEMWSPASPLRPVLEQLASFSRLSRSTNAESASRIPFRSRAFRRSSSGWTTSARSWTHAGWQQATVVAKGSGGAVGILVVARIRAGFGLTS